jgi:hypothetical protein
MTDKEREDDVVLIMSVTHDANVANSNLMYKGYVSSYNMGYIFMYNINNRPD